MHARFDLPPHRYEQLDHLRRILLIDLQMDADIYGRFQNEKTVIPIWSSSRIASGPSEHIYSIAS